MCGSRRLHLRQQADHARTVYHHSAHSTLRFLIHLNPRRCNDSAMSISDRFLLHVVSLALGPPSPKDSSMFNQIGIGKRLSLAFGLFLLLLCIVIGAGLRSIGTLKSELDEMVRGNLHKTELLSDMLNCMHTVQRVVRTIVVLHNREQRDIQHQKIEKARKDYTAAWEELSRMDASAAGKALRDRTSIAREEALAFNKRIIELAYASKETEAVDLLLDKGIAANDRWEAALNENRELQEQAAREEVARADATYRTTRILLIALGVVAATVAIGLGWLISRSITQPLSRAVVLARGVAAGDLRQSIEAHGKDEPAQLLQALREMNDSLSGTVSSIRNASTALTRSVGELAGASREIEEGSSRQSEAAASTATTVQEITSSITAVAGRAEEVKALSGRSLQQTEDGNRSLSQLVAEIGHAERAVGQISDAVTAFVESTRSITGMTRQVREIADQTNLLALNAAIEAARAGEAGRGFAVVADEVRKLAEKSGQSACEIDTITHTLHEQSESVVQAISRGRESLTTSQGYVDTVVTVLLAAREAAERSAAGVVDITSAVREQGTASNDIAKHIERIAHMAEENHCAMQKTSDAAGMLEQLAVSLQSSVEHFRIH